MCSHYLIPLLFPSNSHARLHDCCTASNTLYETIKRDIKRLFIRQGLLNNNIFVFNLYIQELFKLVLKLVNVWNINDFLLQALHWLPALVALLLLPQEQIIVKMPIVFPQPQKNKTTIKHRDTVLMVREEQHLHLFLMWVLPNYQFLLHFLPCGCFCHCLI